MFEKTSQPAAAPPAGSSEGTPAPAPAPAPAMTGHPIMDKPTAVESGRLQPIATPPPPPATGGAQQPHSPAQLAGPVLTPNKPHRIKWVVLIIVIAALLGVLGVWTFTLNRSPVVDVESPAQPASQSQAVDVDKDRDGLSDSRERELGTMPDNSDSDVDGLTDNEEVTIWNTDPMVQDTDKDGYIDGQEVDNGYNPNGEGKLFNINDINL